MAAISETRSPPVSMAIFTLAFRLALHLVEAYDSIGFSELLCNTDLIKSVVQN